MKKIRLKTDESFFLFLFVFSVCEALKNEFHNEFIFSVKLRSWG